MLAGARAQWLHDISDASSDKTFPTGGLPAGEGQIVHIVEGPVMRLDPTPPPPCVLLALSPQRIFVLGGTRAPPRTSSR